MSYRFTSYHWGDPSFDDPHLQHAYDALTREHLPDPERWLDVLLDSNDVVAQSVALDLLSHGSALQRHGSAEPMPRLAAKAAAIARRNLTDPSLAAAHYRNAILASACEALAHFGSESDVPLLIAVLARSEDTNVLATSAHALGNWLGGDYDVSELIRSAERILGGHYPADVKSFVLSVFDRFSRKEEADFLLSRLRDAPPIGTGAALILANRDPRLYYAAIHEAMRHWPADAPHPADYVRELLADVDAGSEGDS